MGLIKSHFGLLKNSTEYAAVGSQEVNKCQEYGRRPGNLVLGTGYAMKQDKD